MAVAGTRSRTLAVRERAASSAPLSTGWTTWTIMWLRINRFLINRLSVYDRFDVNWLNVNRFLKNWWRVNWWSVNWWRVVTTTSMSTIETSSEMLVRGSFQPGVSIRLVAYRYRGQLQVFLYFCSTWKQKSNKRGGFQNIPVWCHHLYSNCTSAKHR